MTKRATGFQVLEVVCHPTPGSFHSTCTPPACDFSSLYPFNFLSASLFVWPLRSLVAPPTSTYYLYPRMPVGRPRGDQTSPIVGAPLLCDTHTHTEWASEPKPHPSPEHFPCSLPTPVNAYFQLFPLSSLPPPADTRRELSSCPLVPFGCCSCANRAILKSYMPRTQRAGRSCIYLFIFLLPLGIGWVKAE